MVDLESEFRGNVRLEDGVLLVEAARGGSTTVARHRFQPEPDSDYLLAGRQVSLIPGIASICGIAFAGSMKTAKKKLR